MIPITRPQFNDDELKEIKEVLDSGWATRGEKVAELEKMISEYTGVKYVLAVTSCTTALHLALLALGIGQGDEVIVPAFTWVATANVVEMVGATPVFCDIELNTYNINTDLIEKLITKRTKAIIPVHLFGLSADMDEVMKIARKHKLKVVEDAACALGTFYEGKHVGTIGNVGCFSLHPRKAITTGEGGFITTNSKKLYDLMFSLHDHGAPKFDKVGYNYRMNDIQGAVGVAQMRKLEDILAKRQEKAQIYNSNIGYGVPIVPCYSNHTYQSYVIDLGWAGNKRVIKKLAEKGIAARQGTQCVSELPYYRDKYQQDCPSARIAEKVTLTLPLFAEMTKEEQLKVIKEVNELFKPYQT